MRRRFRAGCEPVKARRRKTATLKRRDRAPGATRADLHYCRAFGSVAPETFFETAAKARTIIVEALAARDKVMAQGNLT